MKTEISWKQEWSSEVVSDFGLDFLRALEGMKCQQKRVVCFAVRFRDPLTATRDSPLWEANSFYCVCLSSPSLLRLLDLTVDLLEWPAQRAWLELKSDTKPSNGKNWAQNVFLCPLYINLVIFNKNFEHKDQLFFNFWSFCKTWFVQNIINCQILPNFLQNYYQFHYQFHQWVIILVHSLIFVKNRGKNLGKKIW